ncbi:stage III sporulation protein AD [Fonticella tunisiensis]|uniref:Stage III sporulation protein AD n=1 Tax=Fonticella tunisiensis TaxID=1096341 RepID=A0A4R7KRE6_9CLOT|nr:stage III sporulation protein AD [Fonticella tunisiensis]TDT61951.1 stage III sporulation protein AD [Fonticella tunisiensis]
MEIIQILAIALIAAVILTLLKKEKPEIAIQISLAVGIVIFLFMLGKITLVIESVQQIALKANISPTYLNIILKIIGITYLASLGIEMCRDAEQNAIASKIEFAAKIIIISLAIPIVMAVMDMILKIMP